MTVRNVKNVTEKMYLHLIDRDFKRTTLLLPRGPYPNSNQVWAAKIFSDLNKLEIFQCLRTNCVGGLKVQHLSDSDS